MSTELAGEQLKFVSVLNGFLMKDATGDWLGGAQGFQVTWTGALLVDHDGTYEFWAGAPGKDGLGYSGTVGVGPYSVVILSQ